MAGKLVTLVFATAGGLKMRMRHLLPTGRDGKR
jgi:hypothetical protein